MINEKILNLMVEFADFKSGKILDVSIDGIGNFGSKFKECAEYIVVPRLKEDMTKLLVETEAQLLELLTKLVASDNIELSKQVAKKAELIQALTRSEKEKGDLVIANSVQFITSNTYDDRKDNSLIKDALKRTEEGGRCIGLFSDDVLFQNSCDDYSRISKNEIQYLEKVILLNAINHNHRLAILIFDKNKSEADPVMFSYQDKSMVVSKNVLIKNNYRLSPLYYFTLPEEKEGYNLVKLSSLVRSKTSLNEIADPNLPINHSKVKGKVCRFASAEDVAKGSIESYENTLENLPVCDVDIFKNGFIPRNDMILSSALNKEGNGPILFKHKNEVEVILNKNIFAIEPFKSIDIEYLVKELNKDYVFKQLNAIVRDVDSGKDNCSINDYLDILVYMPV